MLILTTIPALLSPKGPLTAADGARCDVHVTLGVSMYSDVHNFAVFLIALFFGLLFEAPRSQAHVECERMLNTLFAKVSCFIQSAWRRAAPAFMEFSGISRKVALGLAVQCLFASAEVCVNRLGLR